MAAATVRLRRLWATFRPRKRIVHGPCEWRRRVRRGGRRSCADPEGDA